MVKQFIIRNTNLHIIHYLTIHYAIYLIYFKKYLVLSKICVYLSVGGNAKTIYQTGKHATHNTEIIDQLK